MVLILFPLPLSLIDGGVVGVVLRGPEPLVDARLGPRGLRPVLPGVLGIVPVVKCPFSEYQIT